MRKSLFALEIAFVFLGALAACGGGSMSMQPPVGSGTVPVSLTIRDNPPMGVTVLSFELQIKDASLQPSDPMSPPVPLLARPAEVELEELQTESALLSNISVPAGNYSGLTVTFANPQLTILNQTGATLMVGGQNCLNGQICELTPKLNSTTAMVQAPTQPFPIMLSASAPVELRMDFNVNAAIQQNDLSITPAIVVTQFQKSQEGEGDEIRSIGVVTAVDSMAATFTVQDAFSGNSSTFSTNSDTEFRFEDACGAENFSCLKMGQVVIVKAQQMQDGSLLATKVKLLAEVNRPAITGTISAVNSGGTSFQVVIAFEDGMGEGSMNDSRIGVPLTVNLAQGTTFDVDADGLTLPAGLNFAGPADLMVGQAVRVHPTGLSVSGTLPNIAITADQVHLEPSQATGSVMAINPNATPPNFSLGNLPPLFTNSGTSALQVEMLPTTTFEDISGLSGLNNGDRVSAGGFLFNSTNPPTMVAERVVKRESD